MASSVVPEVKLSYIDILKRLGAPLPQIDADKLAHPFLKPFFEKRDDYKLSLDELKNIIKYCYFFFKGNFFLIEFELFTHRFNFIANYLNKLAQTRDILYVLVPGDSGSKISKYIQILNLCPKCRFFDYPLSRELFEEKNDIYWDNLELLIPNFNLSDLVIIDYIQTGRNLIKMVEKIFNERKIRKGIIPETNLPIVKKIIDEIIYCKERDFLFDGIGPINEDDINKNLIIKYNGSIEYVSSPRSGIPENYKPLVVKILDQELKIITENKNLDEKISLNINEIDDILLGRISGVDHIIDLNILFNYDNYLNPFIGHAEFYNARCQPKMVTPVFPPVEHFDIFGCDFFVYLLIIYSNNKDSFIENYELIGKSIIGDDKEKKIKELINVEGIDDPELSLEDLMKIISTAVGGAGSKLTKSFVLEKLRELKISKLSKEAEAYVKTLEIEGGYYNKYLKYKEKYLALKKQIL
jgi:hypothetical protein